MFGGSLLEMYKSLDIHIVNGRFTSDTQGHMTFISSRGASVIDHFVASAYLFKYITDTHVLSCDISSQLPVKLSMNYERNVQNHPAPKYIVNPRNRFIWRETLGSRVLEKFVDDYTHGIVQVFQAHVGNGHVNLAAERITTVYNHVCREMKTASGQISKG